MIVNTTEINYIKSYNNKEEILKAISVALGDDWKSITELKIDWDGITVNKVKIVK